MKARAILEGGLLGLFLLSGGIADASHPVEVTVPVTWHVSGQRLMGVTLPFGIVYLLDGENEEDETPQVQLRIHERRHWATMRQMGVVSYYAHYFLSPGWACREEYRAGWARYHTACR